MTSLRLSIATARLPFPEQSHPLRPLLGKQPCQSLQSPLFSKSFSRQLVWGDFFTTLFHRPRKCFISPIGLVHRFGPGRYDAGVSCLTWYLRKISFWVMSQTPRKSKTWAGSGRCAETFSDHYLGALEQGAHLFWQLCLNFSGVRFRIVHSAKTSLKSVISPLRC